MATAVKISQFQFLPISLSSAIRVSIMDHKQVRPITERVAFAMGSCYIA